MNDELNQQIEEVLVSLVSYGVPLEEARNFDYADAQLYIKAFELKEKRRKQEKAWFDYILSQLIGQSVGCLFTKGGKMRPFKEVYSELFDDVPRTITDEEYIRGQRDEANFLEFAAMMNAREFEEDER